MGNEISQQLVERLLYQGESETLDFKSEPYRFAKAEDSEKVELLKDVLAFANAWRERDAFILIGVKERPGQRAEVLGIDEHIDDASLQEFVSSKTNRPVAVAYRTLAIDGTVIGIIHIPKQPRPVFLLKDFGARVGAPKDERRLIAGTIYYRQGSSTFTASGADVYRMGVDDTIDARPLPAFRLQFADPVDFRDLGTTLALEHYLYVFEEKDAPSYGYSNSPTEMLMYNSRFWADAARHLRMTSVYKAIRFSLVNEGDTTANDVHVEIELPADDEMGVCFDSDMPEPPSEEPAWKRPIAL